MAQNNHHARQTITRSDIADQVYKKVGLSRSESAHLVETVLSNIIDGLIEDGVVKISSFGNFTVKSKNERVGRNPKTGIEVPITARRVLTFKASPVLKQRIDP